MEACCCVLKKRKTIRIVTNYEIVTKIHQNDSFIINLDPNASMSNFSEYFLAMFKTLPPKALFFHSTWKFAVVELPWSNLIEKATEVPFNYQLPALYNLITSCDLVSKRVVGRHKRNCVSQEQHESSNIQQNSVASQ